MYIADAFTNKLFQGNPAAICFVDQWPSEQLMKNIAKENRFSETAFTIKKDSSHYLLRWFTPGGEIDLCGHATLATAFIIFQKKQLLFRINWKHSCFRFGKIQFMQRMIFCVMQKQKILSNTFHKHCIT